MDDNEGRRRSNPDGPVVDKVDDRSPPPSSMYAYRSNFNWKKLMKGCTLIVARATSDYQDNDDDDDDDGTPDGRTTTTEDNET